MIEHLAKTETTDSRIIHTVIEMSGDILSPNLTGHEVLVCHQVNCMGVMGAGLAKYLCNLFPGLLPAYQSVCKRYKAEELLGTTYYYPVNYNGFDYVIANIFGQVRYGRDRCYTNYDALRQAFRSMRTMTGTYYGIRPSTRIRIPYRMGCGLAGGNWTVVQSIIQEELVDHGIIVEIWKKE